MAKHRFFAWFAFFAVEETGFAKETQKSLRSLLRPQHLAHCIFQGRQVVLDDIPDLFQIDPEVVVYQGIAEAGYLVPLDPGLAFLGARREPLRGFGQGLEIPDHGVLHE